MTNSSAQKQPVLNRFDAQLPDKASQQRHMSTLRGSNLLIRSLWAMGRARLGNLEEDQLSRKGARQSSAATEARYIQFSGSSIQKILDSQAAKILPIYVYRVAVGAGRAPGSRALPKAISRRA